MTEALLGRLEAASVPHIGKPMSRLLMITVKTLLAVEEHLEIAERLSYRLKEAVAANEKPVDHHLHILK